MRITAKEYAKRFGVGIATVYRHIKSEKLPSKRIDGVAYVIIENDNGRDNNDNIALSSDDGDEPGHLVEQIKQLQNENTALSSENERLADEARGFREQIEPYQKQLETKDTQISQLQVQKDADIERLVDQLTTKDDQISELHQLVALAQTNQSDTLKQLEDLRGKRKWWRFWA